MSEITRAARNPVATPVVAAGDGQRRPGAAAGGDWPGGTEPRGGTAGQRSFPSYRRAM